jgi:cytosine/adenosine deaminase-related metal-dependent hydrolase
MSSAMLRALRFAYLALRGDERNSTGEPEAIQSLLSQNAVVAGEFLGEPLLGELAPGAPADLIAVASPPPTPLTEANLFGHLVFGASESPVRHTVARGRVLLDDFAHTTLDPAELATAAGEMAPALWERFHALEWGTRYLGADVRNRT